MVTTTYRNAFTTSHKFAAAGARKDRSPESFPDIPVANPTNPFERTLEPPEGDEGNSVTIRKVAWDKAAKDKEPTSNGDAIPFEDGAIDAEDMYFTSASGSFLTEENIFHQDQEYSSGRTGNLSTITVQERDAFQRIFADIQSFSQNNRNSSTGAFSAEDDPFTMRSKRKKEAQGSVLDLIEDVAFSPIKAYTLNSQDKLLKIYPPSLRAAAAKALGVVSVNATKPPAETDNELEVLRQPELDRVETLLRAAATDIELWKVMEKEVFSLPRKLGLVDEVSKNGSRVKKGRKRRDVVEDINGSEDPAVQEQAHSMNLAVHGPLYPSHLLLSLRLLDRSFEKPSPLVLNILPRVKSLGLISHALGASTALYNELLRIYWMRYDNFRGVLDLLMELERVGLEVDEETLRIISQISSLQAGIKAGQKGPVVQALWSMPEFAPEQFTKWRTKIETFLEAQERQLIGGR